MSNKHQTKQKIKQTYY